MDLFSIFLWGRGRHQKAVDFCISELPVVFQKVRFHQGQLQHVSSIPGINPKHIVDARVNFEAAQKQFMELYYRGLRASELSGDDDLIAKFQRETSDLSLNMDTEWQNGEWR